MLSKPIVPALLLAATVLSGCMTTQTKDSQASAVRAAHYSKVPFVQMSLASYRVSVPRNLVVSEQNLYYPKGDIVWREDPYGDRYKQVDAIFRTGLNKARALTRKGVPVRADVVVTRFHALSQKARYHAGGVHYLEFTLALHNARTGALMEPPRRIITELKALGGDEAIAAEAKGITQKKRITDHIARVIRDELTTVQGHIPENFGWLSSLNRSGRSEQSIEDAQKALK